MSTINARNSVTPVKTLFHLLLSAAELTPFVANLRRVAFREVHDEIMSVRLFSRLISGKTTRNDRNFEQRTIHVITKQNHGGSHPARQY